MKHLFSLRLCQSILLALFSFGATGHAATYTVDRTDDAAISACSAASNDCTLRGAITKTNATAGDDIILFDTAVFATPKTIILATAFENLGGNVTITGPGADKLTLTAATSSVFSIFRLDQAVNATFSGLTLSNVSAGIYSGAVCNVTVTNCTVSGNTVGISNNQGGTVIATNCTVTGNSSYGFVNNGPLTATNCTLSGNYVGIHTYNRGMATLTLNHCTVSSNTTDGIYIDGCKTTATGCTLSGNGNGIRNTGNTLTAINCTLSGNSTNGIANAGTLAVTNCTVSGNGNGIENNTGTVTATSCTVSGNSTNGIVNNVGPVTLKNTLVAGNSTNVSGYVTDGGFNITSGTAAQAGLDPAGLQNNGGPTKTIRLLPGSAAIDQGNSFGVTTDQRGAARPFDNANIPNAPGGDGSDIGAFELFVPTLAVNNPRSLPEGNASASGSITFDITLSVPTTQTVTVNYQTRDGINSPAIAGVDYVEKHGKMTFAPGETLKRVTIQFIGDSVPEPSETFFFDLTTPTNATIADSRGVGQINNDDGPSITIEDAITIDEGPAQGAPAGTIGQKFIVRLSAASTDTITVNWGTSNDTAGGDDFVAASGTLTFAPGQTSKLITIQVNGDTNVEPNETYKVALSKPAYAMIGDAQATGTIRNDDAAAQLFQNDEPSQ